MHQRHFSLINLSVLICAGLALSCPISASAADTTQLTVHIDRPGVKISPMLYGLMTEEINFSYDGGLYGELIRNRAFKDRDTEPAHWSLLQTDGAEGKIELDSTNPVNATALPKSLRLEITKVPSGGRVGIANDGYWGIPVHPNTTYRASFYAKAIADFKGPLTIGQVGESADNRFVISADSPGTIWFSLVSLFPPTFNDRPNGTRIDI